MRHNPMMRLVPLACVLLTALGCEGQTQAPATDEGAGGDAVAQTTAATGTATPGTDSAEVTAATASGDPGAYQFAVTIQSPDTGCERYADWWEVITEDGQLLYRRILAHSHVDEQPFTRSGGPVAVQADQTVIVRAHMNPGGYGTAALRGSVEAGFTATDLDATFAAAVAEQPPLPDGCAF